VVGEPVDQPDPEELILNCYRLAHRYHQNPDVFLSMSISDIGRHIHYTIRQIELRKEAQSVADDDDE
jgi:hypothetical protein